MLEGDGLAERWEASQKFETPKYKWLKIISKRYFDFIDEDLSLVLKAMEILGPR